MKLHFPIKDINKGIEELKSAKTPPTNYDWDKRETVPCELAFMLVGDQGVYLMPNTKDGKHNSKRGEDGGNFVIYANECDPTKMEFDDWWANKNASFGGDDGAEFIAMTEIESLINGLGDDKHLVIELSAVKFEMSHD